MGGLPWPQGSSPIPTSPPCPLELLTTHRSHRLVSLAVRTVTLPGATSGGACRVWMTREGWLRGLEPTTFTCRIRNLEQGGERGTKCCCQGSGKAPWLLQGGKNYELKAF